MSFFSLQKYVICGQIGLSVDNGETEVSCCLKAQRFCFCKNSGAALIYGRFHQNKTMF
jgi:hypothetical protein